MLQPDSQSPARKGHQRPRSAGGGEVTANHYQWSQAWRSPGGAQGTTWKKLIESHGCHGETPTDVGANRVRTVATCALPGRLATSPTRLAVWPSRDPNRTAKGLAEGGCRLGS